MVSEHVVPQDGGPGVGHLADIRDDYHRQGMSLQNGANLFSMFTVSSSLLKGLIIPGRHLLTQRENIPTSTSVYCPIMQLPQDILSL